MTRIALAAYTPHRPADALGQYHADVLLTQPGTWYWRWQSGHPSIGVAEGRITVQPSRFSPE